LAAQFCLAAGISSVAILISVAQPAGSRADDANPPAPAASAAADQPSVAPAADNSSHPAHSATAADDTANLVTKLGDSLFAVRESASNQLVQKGIVAKPQLLAALESSDAEVRFRAKHILAEVVQADFQRRLSAFSADVDGKLNLSMPGWPAYKQAVGGDRAARELFVEMQQAEGPLLEAYEQGPKQASEKLRAQLAAEPAMIDRAAALAAGARGRRMVQVPVQSSTSSLGSVLAWLFVAGDAVVPLSDDITGRVVMLPSNGAFQQAVPGSSTESNPRSEVCRKILGRWITREVSPTFAAYNLLSAYAFNLKEGLQPAVSVLKQPQANGDIVLRYRAMLLVGRYGSKEHVPLLEPFLKDSQICYDSGGISQPVQTQIRDIALLMAVKLAGQDPKQFGFDRWQGNNDQLPLNLHTIGFRNQEEREAALQKWEDWQTGQKSAAGAEAGTKAAGEKSG
jgi:hypothetical protein